MQNVPLYNSSCQKLASLNVVMAAAGMVSGTTFTASVYDPAGSFDFPILGVAAAVKLTDRMVEDVRLVLGAVGSSPVDQSDVARPLVGTRPTREAIQAVAAAAYKGARPLDNTDLNYAWRKKMARVYVERALAHVCNVAIPEILSPAVPRFSVGDAPRDAEPVC